MSKTKRRKAKKRPAKRARGRASAKKPAKRRVTRYRVDTLAVWAAMAAAAMQAEQAAKVVARKAKAIGIPLGAPVNRDEHAACGNGRCANHARRAGGCCAQCGICWKAGKWTMGQFTAARKSGAAIPFMITRAMKQALRDLGFSDEQIKYMTPKTAHAHINKP